MSRKHCRCSSSRSCSLRSQVTRLARDHRRHPHSRSELTQHPRVFWPEFYLYVIALALIAAIIVLRPGVRHKDTERDDEQGAPERVDGEGASVAQGACGEALSRRHRGAGASPFLSEKEEVQEMRAGSAFMRSRRRSRRALRGSPLGAARAPAPPSLCAAQPLLSSRRATAL